MTAAYLVLYEGRPEDPEAFLHYYLTRHVPLVWAFPRIRGVEVHIGDGDGDFFMVTRLLFDDLADLRAAITSEARRVAREDMRNLPAFSGRVRHQATEVKSIPWMP